MAGKKKVHHKAAAHAPKGFKSAKGLLRSINSAMKSLESAARLLQAQGMKAPAPAQTRGKRKTRKSQAGDSNA